MIRYINSKARETAAKHREEAEERGQQSENKVASMFQGIRDTIVNAARSATVAANVISTLVPRAQGQSVQEDAEEEPMMDPDEQWMALFSDVKSVGEDASNSWRRVRFKTAAAWEMKADLTRHSHQRPRQRASKFSKRAGGMELLGIGRLLRGLSRESPVNEIKQDAEQDEADDGTNYAQQQQDTDDLNGTKTHPHHVFSVTTALTAIAKIKSARAQDVYAQDDPKHNHEVLYGPPSKTRLATGPRPAQMDAYKHCRDRARRMATRKEAKRQEVVEGSPVALQTTERRLRIGEFVGPSLLAPEALEPDHHKFLRPLTPEEDQEATDSENFPEELLCDAIAVLSERDVVRLFQELDAAAGAKRPENGLALLEMLFLGPHAHRPELFPLQWSICQWVLSDLHRRMIDHIRTTKGVLHVGDRTVQSDSSAAELGETFRRRLVKVQELIKKHQERAPNDALNAMAMNEQHVRDVVSHKSKKRYAPNSSTSTDFTGISTACTSTDSWTPGIRRKQKPIKTCIFPYAPQRPSMFSDSFLRPDKEMVAPIWVKAQTL